jgi:hypothetical protein
MVIKKNGIALQMNMIIILSGFILIGVSTLALNIGLINSTVWMILLGLGTYLGYLPFNCLIFDRMIAAFGSAANAGFFIYIADSFGYLGSVGTLIFKYFSHNSQSWSSFLNTTSYSLAVFGSLLTGLALVFFSLKLNDIQKFKFDKLAYHD